MNWKALARDYPDMELAAAWLLEHRYLIWEDCPHAEYVRAEQAINRILVHFGVHC